MTRVRYTPEERLRIAAQAGTSTEIAERFQLHPTTVQLWRNKLPFQSVPTTDKLLPDMPAATEIRTLTIDQWRAQLRAERMRNVVQLYSSK